MESEYTKQANDFMEKTGTTMETKLLGNMPYFEDDKENRDVYQITLRRPVHGKTRVWSFRFGQSIANSGDKVKRNPYGKTMYDHELISRKRIIPTAYDILAGITKNDPGTFDDFCGYFGYDTDSRKAEKIYFDVQKEWKEVSNIFGDVMYELQEIA